MKYFFDTEFIEDGRTIDLISIGMVAEDGREFYACSTEAELDKSSEWVRKNVLPQLPTYGDPAWMDREEIRYNLKAFTVPSLRPEFWAYYADYDWVALCQIFGKMVDLPPSYPMFCMDLKQLSVWCGSPTHPEQKIGKHNALEDARWNKLLFDFLWKRV